MNGRSSKARKIWIYFRRTDRVRFFRHQSAAKLKKNFPQRFHTRIKVLFSSSVIFMHFSPSITNFHANPSDIRVHKDSRCPIWLWGHAKSMSLSLGGGGFVGRATTIVWNDVIYCFFEWHRRGGGGGSKNCNFWSEIPFAWTLRKRDIFHRTLFSHSKILFLRPPEWTFFFVTRCAGNKLIISLGLIGFRYFSQLRLYEDSMISQINRAESWYQKDIAIAWIR